MTITPLCALCLSELTDKNKTKEHIIPHAIGGREKIEGFICSICNRRKGTTWDADLAAQLNWFAVMIGIIRERSEPPPERVSTVSGEEFLLKNDGALQPAKFKYEKIENGSGATISFTARTHREARKKINEISRKYPKFDKEAAIANAKFKTSYLDEPINVQIIFGGPSAGRSVVTTALAFAFWKGINPHSCENVIDFLRDENAPSSCYGLSYLNDIVKNRPDHVIFHCVAIHGDKRSRRLLAYVEYFSLARWLIVLSNNYDGPEIKEAYAIDPTTANIIDIELCWSLTSEMIKQVVDGFGYTDESYKEAITKSLDKIMRRSDERAYNNAIKAAFLAAGKKLGLKIGDQIGSNQSGAFASILVDELRPFILHRMGAKSKPKKSDD